MEKISGILPATTRVTSVDLRNSGTARPGAPAFGRTVGISAAAEKQALIAREKAALDAAAPQNIAGQAQVAFENQMKLRDTTVDPKAEIVKRMSEAFFVNNAARAAAPVVEAKVATAAPDSDMVIETTLKEADVNPSSMDEMQPSITKLVAQMEAEATAPAAEESEPVGRYLDVRA